MFAINRAIVIDGPVNKYTSETEKFYYLRFHAMLLAIFRKKYINEHVFFIIFKVTYMIEGATEHEDFVGHRGVIQAGDLQWMTAGRGIVHCEMPHGKEVLVMHLFIIHIA